MRTGDKNGLLWGEGARDWADIQEGQCRPLYEAVFERAGLRAGLSHLDAGCGAGMAAGIAAGRGAQVSGLDSSEPLLAIARERVPGGDFHRGDLEALPFEADRFDLVTGFNSFQYAGDPGAALREAKRVAKPGGLVAVATWAPPEGMQAASLIAALKPLLPPPPPGAPGPFALSAEEDLRAFAARAGLAPLEILDVETPWSYPDLDTALRGLRSSGVAARALAAAGRQAVDAAHVAALAPFKDYRIGAAFRCLLARA